MMDRPKRFRRAFARAQCKGCGKPIFQINRRAAKFCSSACRQAAYRARYANPQADIARVTHHTSKPLKSLAEKGRFSRSSIPVDLGGGWFRGAIDPVLRRAVLATESRLLPDEKPDDGVKTTWSDADYPRLSRSIREMWDGLDIPAELRRAAAS